METLDQNDVCWDKTVTLHWTRKVREEVVWLPGAGEAKTRGWIVQVVCASCALVVPPWLAQRPSCLYCCSLLLSLTKREQRRLSLQATVPSLCCCSVQRRMKLLQVQQMSFMNWSIWLLQNEENGLAVAAARVWVTNNAWVTRWRWGWREGGRQRGREGSRRTDLAQSLRHSQPDVCVAAFVIARRHGTATTLTPYWMLLT